MKKIIVLLTILFSTSIVTESIASITGNQFEMTQKKKKKRKKKKKKSKKGKEAAFEQGQISAHVGVGIAVMSKYGDVGYGKETYQYFGENKFKKKLPFNLMVDYGVHKYVSLGIQFGSYAENITITDKTNPNNEYGFNQKFKQYSLRTTGHIPVGSDKLDPYASFTLGYNTSKVDKFGTFNYLNEYKGGFAWSAHVGANYYFNDYIGAYVEVGYGRWQPIANVGLSLKF